MWVVMQIWIFLTFLLALALQFKIRRYSSPPKNKWTRWLWYRWVKQPTEDPLNPWGPLAWDKPPLGWQRGVCSYVLFACIFGTICVATVLHAWPYGFGLILVEAAMSVGFVILAGRVLLAVRRCERYRR